MTQEYLGDKVEKALRAVGADKVAKIYEKVGKRPCGCQGRKEALNRWHRRVLEEVEKVKRSIKEGKHG